jgi:SnoaL-like domain
VDRSDVAAWIDRYVEAWGTNDPKQIGALFTDDARYYTAPHREPWTGREAIVREWLGRKDEPGSWSFRWEIRAVCDDIGFVRCWIEYPHEEHDYSSLWEIALDDKGQCSEFVEWFMEIKRKA